jgi:hypothetical protein
VSGFGVRFDDLVAIQSQLSDVVIGDADVAVWDSRNGTNSCADTWGKLRESLPVVKWWKLVWHPLAIPKYSFILWLTFRDALVTKQKMCCWDYGGNGLCLSCYGSQESKEHPFFRCSFSGRIWSSIMADCSFKKVPLDWDYIEHWGAVELQGKGLKASLGRLCLVSLLHCNQPRTEDAILKQIRWDVRSRMITKGKFKCSGENVEIMHRWNLQV